MRFVSPPRRAMMSAALALAFTVHCVACDDETAGYETIDDPVDEGGANDVVSERVCDMLQQCRCGDVAGVQLAGCSLWLGFAWQDTVDEAHANGWTYDGDCLTARLNGVLERGCETPTGGVYVPGCQGETCLIYHGSVAEGEPCEGRLAASDCAQGLVCFGTCQQPCAGQTVDLGEGAACLDDNGVIGACAQNLLCDPASRTCRSLPLEGETCMVGACAPGLWCDPSDIPLTCRALRADGQPCLLDQVCAGGWCAAGQCAQLPGVGEACRINPLAPCQAGLACVAGACAQPPSADEPCLSPLHAQRCADGLVCGAKLCSALPDSVPECALCPPGQPCLGQVCMREPPAVCADLGGVVY